MAETDDDSARTPEQAAREELERRLMDEAQQMVERLERALEAAPDDEELRTRLREVADRTRALRDTIAGALAPPPELPEPGTDESATP